jgi:predicted ATPase/DNA-binding SARP family transcriptional activator
MTLRVQLCGEFRVWRGKKDLTHSLTRLGKPKTLLKIFVTHAGRIFSQDELIELLWPDAPADASAVNLRKRISELRKALEPHLSRGSQSQYILTRPGGYCFNAQAPYTTDILESMRAWEEGQRFESAGQFGQAICEYERAIALTQGEFLAEDRYEEWTLALRERWHEMVLKTLSRLAECYARLREYQHALEQCRKILELAPTSESAYRQKMLYHYLAGEESEAAHTYQTCVETLKRALDLQPSPETRALYEQIIKREVSVPPPTALHNLPQELSSFIGREREISQIKQLLFSARLLTLTGPGGCGKTRLALKVAADLVRDFRDGVWLIELATLADPTMVAHRVSTVLGLREPIGRSPLEALLAHLKPKNILLVLDNCEHLVHACARCAATLLQACPNLQIMATSREALGVRGETLFAVPPLSLPDPSRPLPTPKVLQQYEAISLFVERAQALVPGFRLTKQNAPAVVQICRSLDGLPLAIELAAARVRSLSVAQIALRLDDRFRLLSEGSRTALPHQQTLQATMDWSFNLLSEQEQALLRRLSVFSGGFTLEAVESVCADAPASHRRGVAVGREEVLRLLTHLIDKSLVKAEEQGAEMGYWLLETVREYSRGKLMESGEAKKILQQHQQYFIALAEQAWNELDGPNQALWLDRLEAEHDNLRSALSYSLQQPDPEPALRLAKTLWWFWYIRGHLNEGRQWLQKALEKAHGMRTELYARVLNGAGRLACEQGDYATARAIHEETLKIYRELNDRRGIASQFVNLGVVASYQGKHQLACLLYEQALPIFQELGNKWGMANVLGNLSSAATEQGEYVQAQSYAERELALCRELGDHGRIAWSLNKLGGLAHHQGDYERASALYEESLALFRQLGDKGGIASSLSSLGSVAYSQGDFSLAQVRYEESLAIRRELGDKQHVAYLLNSLGSVALRQGEHERARTLFEESLSLFREMEVRGGIAGSLSGLASVAYHQREYSRAAALYQESLRLRCEGGEKPNIIDCLEGLAAVAHAQRQLHRAVTLFAAAQALRDALGVRMTPRESADQQRELAVLRTELGEKAFASVWAQGQAMALEHAIEYALADSLEIGNDSELRKNQPIRGG